MKRLALAALAVLWASVAWAAPQTICNLPGSANPQYCLIINSDGSITATLGGVGTQDVNLTKVGGVVIALGATTSASSLPVTLATDSAGITPLGNAAMASSVPVTMASNQTTFPVQAAPTPVTSGGLSNYLVEAAASDNHVVIKAGAGQVYHINITNKSGAIQYVRLYNATTGFNGCNSATNIVYEAEVPFQTSNVAGYMEDIGPGIAFSTGISICYTGGFGQTDTTNATASASVINIGYK